MRKALPLHRCTLLRRNRHRRHVLGWAEEQAWGEEQELLSQQLSSSADECRRLLGLLALRDEAAEQAREEAAHKDDKIRQLWEELTEHQHRAESAKSGERTLLAAC